MLHGEWTIDLTEFILDAGTFHLGRAIQKDADAETDVTAVIEACDAEELGIIASVGNWNFYVSAQTLEFLAQLARVKLRLSKEEE